MSEQPCPRIMFWLNQRHHIFKEMKEEFEGLCKRVKDLEYEVEHWKGELRVRMHPIDYDALVNGDGEE